MKKKILRILILFLAVVALGFVARANSLRNSPTAFAVGDLEVDWGVPDGDPIFVVEGMMPGDTETRIVQITNNAATEKAVRVRGIKTEESKDFSMVLNFVISQGSDIYGGTSPTGPKTLDEFFTESAGLNGIFLFNLAPSESKSVSFTATFDELGGNDFQEARVVFDLEIGITIEVPEECSLIDFTGDIIFGTEGNDSLWGTNENDLIILFGGNDFANSSNGDDCIIGGPGRDILQGSNGNDILFGNEGNDRLDGGDGVDLMFGGEGNDRINGSNGNDKIFGEEGNDKIEGGNDDDEIDAGPGNDTVRGGNGNDTIFGREGHDNIDGQSGDDLIEGNENNDTLKGGQGQDTLIGGAGIDSANGGMGIDTCDAEVEISCEL